MKHLLQFSAATVLSLAAAGSANAQASINIADLKALATKPTVSAKTTATLQRITGIHISSFDGATFNASDSGRLTYTGIRGSDLFGNVLDFDDFIIVHYDMGTSLWENVQKQMQTFNGLNLKLTANSQAWNTGTSMWDNGDMYSYTYDSNNDKVQELRQTWDVGTMTYQNAGRTSYLYDGAHNVTQSVEQVWNTGTSTWDNNYKITYSYTGNQLDMSVSQYWSGGTWTNSSKYIYQYSGGNLASSIYQYWSGSAYVNSSRNVYTYTGSNRMSDIYQTWSGSAWENSSRSTYTYNSMNYPIAQETMSWNSGSSSWEYVAGSSSRARITYETYTNSVKQLAASTGALTAYPVPAQNTLTLSLKNDKAVDASIAIYDALGRVVMQWNEHANANYTKTIPVAQLPAGNYTIGFRTADAMETCRFVIAK